MTVFPILAVSFIMNVVAVLFVICCVSLVLIILIQKGRGGGLSGAFGGAMASGILGSKTGDFLTWVTIVLVGVFLTLAVVMAKLFDTRLIRLQCYEGLDASSALYEWNYPKQLLHIRLAEQEKKGVEDSIKSAYL